MDIAESVVALPSPHLYCPATLPWYAVRVRPKFEKVTSDVLNSKGFEEFLPTYAVRNRWSDRLKTVELPLFPGYVFCRIDLERRLPVLMTYGVVGIVGAGKTPLAIPDDEIRAIQTVARAGCPAAPWPYLSTGQKVRVTRGPMRGVEGFVVTIKNGLRLVLSVSMLQRSVAVEVDRDFIEPF